MVKNKKDLGEIYEQINEYLIKYQGINRIISKDMITDIILGKLMHTSAPRRFKILKELVDYGFLLQISRGRAGILYKVLG